MKLPKYDQIPVPPLEDVIKTRDGEHYINRDNAELVRHEHFSEMDHVFIREVGRYGMYIFHVDASPIADIMETQGYDKVKREYPNLLTQRTWLQFTLKEMEHEIEEGKGHEIE